MIPILGTREQYSRFVSDAEILRGCGEMYGALEKISLGLIHSVDFCKMVFFCVGFLFYYLNGGIKDRNPLEFTVIAKNLVVPPKSEWRKSMENP